MAATILRQANSLPNMDAPLVSLITGLNIISIAAATVTFLLSSWFWLRRYSAPSNTQRCRVVMILSISSASYSVSQLLLSTQPAYGTSPVIIRVVMFVTTLSVVFNSFLVVGSIGMDSAVRYGLRSFGFAQRLCGFSEIACFVGALVVSQPVLYLFDSPTWTGLQTVVVSSQSAFEAAVWMTESAWVLLSLAMATALSVYAIVKANKYSRYTANVINMSTTSVLGTATSVQKQVTISLCYVLVFVTLYSWKLAFRVSGSTSEWLLYAAAICELLQPLLTLLVFVADMAINMQPTEHTPWQSASTICAIDTYPSKSVRSRTDCKSFTTWGKAGFLEWQNSCKQSAKHIPENSNVKMWIDEVKRCHIRSEFSHYEDNSASVLFDGSIKRNSDFIVLHPL